MKLVIVESPNKCKKIESYLGNGWIVKASVGHIRDLPEKEFGVDTESFRPTYVLTSSGKKAVSNLKKAVSGASEVYIATDPDREGEAIGWHVKVALGIKEYKRVVFNEITKNEVQKSIRNPRKLDMNLIRAQEARRILDRMVGYMVSPVLSKAYNRRMSAGRVQSPAVLLVVEREFAIRNFKPTDYLDVFLEFNTNSILWKAQWNWKRHYSDDNRPEYFTDRTLAEKAAAIRDVIVSSIEKKKATRRAPAPFITSSLIRAASTALKIDSDDTMKVAQTLFEHGLITYHRTDNPNLSAEAISMVHAWLQKNNLGSYIADPANKWKAKDGAQEAHEAIRPTDFSVERANLDDPRANLLYELIWKRAVACQMKAAEFEVTTVQLESRMEHDGQSFVYVAKGKVKTYQGWTLLTDRDCLEDDDSKEKQDEQALPKMDRDDHLQAVSGAVEDKQTRPPGRFNEASLVEKLEAEGIGRPATYASIMKNIKSRGYIEVKKRQFHATDLGISLIDSLKGRFGFVALDYTRSVEDDLDGLANGKADYVRLMQRVHQGLLSEIGSIENLQVSGFEEEPKKGKKKGGTRSGGKAGKQDIDKQHSCPKCKEGFLQKRSGSKGAFWGCSRYPDCKETRPDDNGKPAEHKVQKVNAYQKIDAGVGKDCPQGCGGKQIMRTFTKGKSAGRSYLGCSNFPDCRYFHWTKNAE